MFRSERGPQWGRVKSPGATVLRRGAWYRVVASDIPNRVVLDTGFREVALHEDLVDLRDDRPAKFSVVIKRDTDRNPAAGTVYDLGLEYAVCPLCRERVEAPKYEPTLECTACFYRGQLDWDHPC